MDAQQDLQLSLEQKFPYECITLSHYTDVVPWCEVMAGEFDRDWYRYGTDIAAGVTGWDLEDRYRFRDEQVAILFRLRWS